MLFLVPILHIHQVNKTQSNNQTIVCLVCCFRFQTSPVTASQCARLKFHKKVEKQFFFLHNIWLSCVLKPCFLQRSFSLSAVQSLVSLGKVELLSDVTLHAVMANKQAWGQHGLTSASVSSSTSWRHPEPRTRPSPTGTHHSLTLFFLTDQNPTITFWKFAADAGNPLVYCLFFFFLNIQLWTFSPDRSNTLRPVWTRPKILKAALTMMESLMKSLLLSGFSPAVLKHGGHRDPSVVVPAPVPPWVHSSVESVPVSGGCQLLLSDAPLYSELQSRLRI